uniref:Uncharacterized protein n=1 Tax=Haptolina brevifila TaxID=156173 RepID=A0A7S2NFA2_9EUKA|mmetsp:Transcript_76753/g.152174  ORF Transcript_76753/g.152174 Transcript_76753/m.152174 type:complete len:107 (+) Transcript_76753:389-709(+)
MVLSEVLFARRGLLTTHLFWKVSSDARRMARAWLQLALDQPRAFCASHTQDQAAFTVLAINQSLPLINMCPFMRPPWLKGKCHDHQKLLSAVVGALGRGAFSMQKL